jgi:hypothetical protein
MRPLLVAALIIMSVTGCKKNEADADPTAKSELVTKLGALADEACACKDMACADKVSATVTALGQANKDFDPGDLDALQAIQNRMDPCLAALNPVIVAYLDLSKQACACTDKACTDKVAGKFTKWIAAFKASKKPLRANEGNVLMTAGKTAGDCMTKLGTAIPR